MIMNNRPTSKASQGKSMVFLASHGLQTPLSAIRWGIGRLKHMSKGLSPEQAAIVDGVHGQAKLLSQMFDSLLLLAKVDEGTPWQRKKEDIYLRDFFLTLEETKNLPPDLTLALDCADDLRLRIDRKIFDGIVHALLIVASTGARMPKQALPVKVEIDTDEELCTITFAAPLQLSLVEDVEMGTVDPDARMIVGGVPGLMLSVASSLSNAIGGHVDVAEKTGIVVRLPAPESVSVLPE
jgi:signal transduction histidine kinase